MASELSPMLACRIADSAYATLNSSDPAIAAAAKLNEMRDEFDVVAGSVFAGTTGSGARTNFGYVAHGKSATRQGETVVAVRGTVTVPDWLTDAHFSTARSATGYPVHAGFNQLANGILPQVALALSGRNPHTIHVVGHSLGGGAGALIADKLRDFAAVKLYTFGAPRASYKIHVDYLTHRLGRTNIFRAYHDTDPVPLLPIFPYIHSPAGAQGYLMRGSGAIISFDAHKLDQYAKNMTDAWASIPTIPHRRFSLDTVDDLLEAADAIPAGYLSARLLRLIVRALGLILSGLGGVTGLIALGAVSVIDQIAYAISVGVNVLTAGKELVQRLVAQIMRWLGIAIVGTVNVTIAFLRWLAERLFQTISQMAALAIRNVMPG